MRRLTLVLALYASAPARAAEWFTVMGDLADAGTDTVQVDLENLPPRGAIRYMDMRVNLAETRTIDSGEKVGSYVSRISIDCDQDAIEHVEQTRFEGNYWRGRSSFQRFSENRPMAFRGLLPNPKARILRAACAAGS